MKSLINVKFIALILILIGCSKEENDQSENVNLPQFNYEFIEQQDDGTVLYNLNITDNGGGEIKRKGVVFGVAEEDRDSTPQFRFNTAISVPGAYVINIRECNNLLSTCEAQGTGSFWSTNSSDTLPSMGYKFFRPFVENSAGAALSPSSMKVLIGPAMELIVESIGLSSAVITLEGLDKSIMDINRQGFVISRTNSRPTLADQQYGEDWGISLPYKVSVTNLEKSQTYYARGYIEHDTYGIRYGSVVTFTTLSPEAPTVVTKDIHDITSTMAKCDGEVISDNGDPVTLRGVVYSPDPNPTISNLFSFSGSGTGTFTADITALNPGTTYFVRAFAKNNVGYSYGEEKSFKTN